MLKKSFKETLGNQGAISVFLWQVISPNKYNYLRYDLS